jgi:hypothetical protein
MLLREPCRATIPTRSGESLSVLTKAVAGVWRIRGLGWRGQGATASARLRLVACRVPRVVSAACPRQVS